MNGTEHIPMNYKQITIYTTTQAIDIISGFLTMHGVRGVMIEDAQDFTDFLSDTTIHWDYVDEELMRLKTCLLYTSKQQRTGKASVYRTGICGKRK